MVGRLLAFSRGDSAHAVINSLQITRRNLPASKAAFAFGAVSALACVALSLRSEAVNELTLGLTILALGIGVAALSWRLSVYMLLIYLPFAGIAIVATYPSTQFADVVKDLGFVLPAYVCFLLSEPRKSWLFPRLPVILLSALAVIVVVECFNPDVPSVLVALIGLKVWLLYLPMLVLGYRLVQNPSELHRLLTILLCVALVPALIGLGEAGVVDVLGKPQTIFHLYGPAAGAVTQNFAHFAYGARDIWRIPSTFSFVAQYFSFTASMIVIAYAWWRLSGHRWLGIALIALVSLAGFTSGERGALIMLPLLLAMIVMIDGRAKLIAGVALIVLVVLTAAVITLGSGAGLIAVVFKVGYSELYDTTVVGFVETLKLGILGHGTGTATGASRLAFPGTFVLPRFYLESWWLHALYELGAPGLAVAAALLVSLIGTGWRVTRSIMDREVRAVAAAILAFLVWNLIYDLKGSLMTLDPINVYFWLFAGLLIRLGSDFGRTSADQSTVGQPDSLIRSPYVGHETVR